MTQSRRLLGVLVVAFLAAPALAQKGPPIHQPPPDPAAVDPAPQPPLDEAQLKYQQAMMECYRDMVPRHDPSSGEPVDPSAYKMDNQQIQKISKCLADKKVGTPLNPNVQNVEKKYFKKGVRNSQAAAVTLQTEAVKARVTETMEKIQGDAYERVYGARPPAPMLRAAQPLAPPAPATPEKPPEAHQASGAGTYNPVSGNTNTNPGLYNTTTNPASGAGGGNNNNGGGGLWVPQSQ